MRIAAVWACPPALLLFLCGWTFAQDSWTVVGADFQSRSAAVQSINPDGITCTDSTSPEPRLVPWSGLLELDRAAPASPASGPFTLRLSNGDTLAGSPQSIDNDKLTWKNPLLGALEFSEERITSMIRAGQTIPNLDQPRKTDSVRLLNGDETTGVVQGLAAGFVSITPASADAPARIALDKIAAVLLATDQSAPARQPRAFRVWFADGSSLTCPRVQLSGADPSHLLITLAPSHTASVELASISSIEQTNGPIIWLTSLTPAKVVYRPYLEEDFPPQFDHPVDDPAVSIREKFPPFRHGIGVHSFTELTYAIPDGVRAFRTRYAIEKIPSADMTKADVTVRILLDGHLVREIPHIRYGLPTDPLQIEVNNAKELTLQVDYGDNLDAQDRFVWLDPAFLRSAPSTQP